MGGDLPTQFMYATDYPSGGGAKKYSVGSLPAFVARYSAMKPKDRMQYELFVAGFPLKLVFDLEFDPREHPDISMDNCIEALVSRVERAVKKVAHCVPKMRMVRLDANRLTKTSTHIVFPEIIFCNVLHVNAFVNVHLHLDGDLSNVVDGGIYNNDRCFRMYGSQKAGKNNWLLPPGASPKDPLDPILLVDSLCTVVCGKEGLGVEPITLKDVSVPYTHNYRGGVKFEDDFVNNVAQVIQAWIRRTWGERAIYVQVHSNVINFEISPGLPCDIRFQRGVPCSTLHGQHLHNNTYFHYYLYTGEGNFQCTDPDCIAFQATRGKYAMHNYRDAVFRVPLLGEAPPTRNNTSSPLGLDDRPMSKNNGGGPSGSA
jgi:hypothetical protein